MKSPSVVRIWIPGILAVMIYLFFKNAAPVYWLLALPVVLILIFMTTLAEVHDEGKNIYIKLSWQSRHIPKVDIIKTEQSFLDGIGVLQLRKFMYPWGRIFFVYEWSKLRKSQQSSISPVFVSAVLALSGFVAARVVEIPSFGAAVSQARILAMVFASALLVLFLIVRKRGPSFANLMLFMATYLVGLIRW